MACIHNGYNGSLCPTCAAAQSKRIAELEAALKKIADGVIDEGGARRDDPDAAAIAREALTQ